MDEITATFDAVLANAEAVTMSGSLPPGLPASYYARLIARAHKAGVPAFVDCSGAAMSAALAKKPHAIHLTRREAAEVTGRQEAAEALGALLDNCELACVTEGKEGTYIATRDSRLHSLCPVKRVYSAVGSGDCLTAGLCHAHCHGFGPEDTARMASACGAANLLCPELGRLRATDVWRLTESTNVRQLP
jgi:fructose-1-phosphate kinase PfkB-like protein